MSDDDQLDAMTDEELAAQVAALEQQAWLEPLRELRPGMGQLDLFALGFAAGRQAAAQATQISAAKPKWRWTQTQTAACASLISVAATVLVMLSLSNSINPPNSTTAEIAASVPTPAVQLDEVPPLKETSRIDTAGQSSRLTSNIPASIDSANQWPEEFTNQWRERLLIGNNPTLLSRTPSISAATESTASPEIVGDQLSVLNQRRQWLTSLQANDTPSSPQ